MSASISEALLSFRLSISYSMIVRSQAHYPKARRLAQHGGPPGWLEEEIDPGRFDFCT
jgi:hypothetical protein